MTTEKLTVGYDTSEYTTTTSTHIEKTLKEFDELYDLNFPKENWLGKGKIEHFFIKVIIKAFITQALQEQDRESRQQIMKDLEDKIGEYDTNLQQVFRIIKQDEN